MCLILISIDTHPIYKLVIAGNRDEFLDRPTAEASFWEDSHHVLGGRDLKAGGTWMGITRQGNLAAVTNYRNPALLKDNTPSRGHLVSNYLIKNKDQDSFLEELQKSSNLYNPFSIIFGNTSNLWWHSNQADNPKKLEKGVFGLSNHLLDTPWPKLEKSKSHFSEILCKDGDITEEFLFNILKDHMTADDEDLPNTGVPLELERLLSSIFISSPDYGTRSSTLVLIDRNDNVSFIERTYEGNPEVFSTVRFEFRIQQD